MAYDAWLERERVKYENQKRQFIERVGSYETIAGDYAMRAAGTFEYDPTIGQLPTEGLSRQAGFSPTFKPRDVDMNLITDPAQAYAATPGWFWSPSLGISKGTTKSPDEVRQGLTPPMSIGLPGWKPEPIGNKPFKPVIVDNYWTGRL